MSQEDDSEENIENMEEIGEQDSGFSLELGDVIETIAPTNEAFHNQTFFIVYIDADKIHLINISNYQLEKLSVDDEGTITDESISEINLLSRSEDKGFARQNALLPNKWVDVHFGGEIPAIITGQITNLEEDEIEITTFPDEDHIFLNFEYQGLPEDLHIEKIEIRDPPRGALLNLASSGDVADLDIQEEGVSEASMTWTETGESIISIPEGVGADENIREVLHSVYLSANELFGEDLEDIFQVIELPESEKRYSLDVQVNDFTDELLSTIPNSKRTKNVLNTIHVLVERFKELRNTCSLFDDNGNVTGKKIYGDLYKPLIDHIMKLDVKLRWIIPVVAQQKKLYDIGTGEGAGADGSDTVLLSSVEDFTQLDTIYTDYYKNAEVGDEIKYEAMYKRSNEFMTPFSAPTNRDEFLVFKQEIRSDLETVVNNYDDFYSTVSEQIVANKKNTPSSSRTRFLIQKYNLGMSRVQSIETRSNKRYYLRGALTPADTVSIKSFIFMPEPVMKYSAIDLPGTNILVRSQLSHASLDFFRLFKRSRDISQTIVENLNNEIDYETNANDNRRDKGQDDEHVSFLDNMSEFILDDTLNGETDKYAQFLNVIIPKIRVLIRLVKKYMKNKMSFIEVVKNLEPFMIYPENITYGQYNEIRYFIKNQITDYKKNVAEKSHEFQLLANADYKVHKNIHENRVRAMFNEKREINEYFVESYKKYIKKTATQQGASNMSTVLSDGTNLQHMTPSELLFNISETDNGTLYANMLTFMLLSLITPDKLMDSLEKGVLDEMKEGDKIKDKHCVRRFLAKKYTSIADLQKDNGREDLHYDKDYDDTPYAILKKYDDEKKKMLPEKFRVFLAENLVQKHECPRDKSEELADTLIAGKKLVRDGEYAMLELKPSLPRDLDESKLSDKEREEIDIESSVRTHYHYYRRVKGNWTRDNDIDDETFMDNNTLFCNIDFACFKNPVVGTCDNDKMAEVRMKRLATTKAIQEFDKRFSMTVEELKHDLEKNIFRNRADIEKKRLILQNMMRKADFIAYEIGKYADTEALIVSPYAKLFDLVLSQDDFAQKQLNICRIVHEFCREPLVDELGEDAHWFYCKDTNIKLVPQSIFALASAYSSGGDYAAVQDRWCREVGTLSEDGDAIVDKHSGYELRKIDYVAEEGYDEAGYKVTSNGILEKDLGTVASEALSKREIKEAKVFEDETTAITHNILTTLCNNMDISINGGVSGAIEELVMRLSMELITSKDVLLSEKSYGKRAEKIEKEKGKAQIPYKLYKNQTIITIVGGVLLVAIQSVIPALKIRKTFPGCVRSFSGFPLDAGVEDMTGLRYVSCVLNKSKSSIEPWDSIQKLTAPILEKRMKEVLERYVIQRIDVVEMMMKKKEYILLNPDQIPPESHSISKWKQFLPPVVEFSVGNVHNVSSDFAGELMEMFGKGHRDQQSAIDAYKSKNIMFTYGIVENINTIVKTKSLLLKTMSQIPFLENACCNEDLTATHPLSYFAREDNTIDNSIKRCRANEQVLKNIRRISKADFLFNKDNTAIQYPALPGAVMDTNIYLAFIHYCNFDNDIPIPADLETVCREKPDGYDAKWPLEEKMDFLKRHGKRYGVDELHHLMTIVHRRNEVELYHDPVVLPVHMLNDLLESLDTANSSVIEEPLRKLLSDVLRIHNPRTYIDEKDLTSDTPYVKAMIRLRNYLAKTNEKMHARIMGFLDKHGNLSKREYDAIQDFILKMTEWTKNEKNEKNEKNDDDAAHNVVSLGTVEDESIYTIATFFKNSIYTNTQVLPNVILNSVDYRRVHKHWGLADDHLADVAAFIDKNTEEFQKYKSNPVLTRFLLNTKSWAIDLNLFIQHLPIRASIVKDGATFYSLFDKRTILMLLMYTWYSVIYEFIESADDPDLLKMDIVESKNVRRARIVQQNDESELVGASATVDSETAEQEDELLAVEISTGDIRELKDTVCSLLLDFIRKDMKNKKIVDQPYSQIARRVKRTKEQEKKSITDFLQNMEKDERKIEDMLKKFKMGRWNLGMQKGVFQYDKDTYGRDREANLARMYNEVNDFGSSSSASDAINDVPMSFDVNDLDRMDNEEDAALYDAEGVDIGELGEDYNDGVYYAEDADREFGYDG